MKKNFLAVLILVFVCFISLDSKVFAITIGNKNGIMFSSDSSSGGTAAWNDTASVKKIDNIFATTVLTTENSSTHYIKVTGFNFNVPSNATIDGIKVRAKRQYECATCATPPVVMDKVVSLVKNGEITGENRARTQKWESNRPNDVRSYGAGATDLWGTSWSVEDINNPNFGVVLSVELLSGNNVNLSVDWLSVMIFYSTPTSPIISEVPGFSTHTNDITPEYTFTTNSAGTLSFMSNCDSSDIVVVNPGNNTITFNALPEGLFSHCTIVLTDGSSNKSNTLGVTPFRIDTTSPSVTLNGPDTIDLFVGDTYDELGASATDIYIVDGNPVPNSISVDVVGTPDMNHAGAYTITYNATDGAGNIATPVVRTINVKARQGGGGGGNSGGGGGGVIPLYILEQMNQRNRENLDQNIDIKKEGEVLGVTKFIFTLLLKQGSHRVPAKINEIKELQNRLSKEGFYVGKIDGIFGKKTDEAVRSYQKKNHPLWVDGIVGPLTRSYLNK